MTTKAKVFLIENKNLFTKTMQSDLLIKEDEFYKENEILELRTKELLKKVNNVKKIQDNLIKETLKTNNEYSKAKVGNCNMKNTQNCLESFVIDVESPKNEDLNIPNSVNEMGKKGVTHFYRAKIKSLQDENFNLQIENKKKGEEIKKLQKQSQNILEEKEKWFASYNLTKNTIGKLESRISSLNSKLQSKDNEMVSLRKEVEQAKKELKTSSLNLNNTEVRLNRAYEDNEKLKMTLRSLKDEEKESRECYKKQINNLAATVKQIDQHKTELLHGFKKQLELIDNLKKQKCGEMPNKAYLEAYKVAEFSETEYLKMLECKLN